MNSQVTPIILDLSDPGATLEAAGGKGASLARLYAAGFPVPEGFHITTGAYRRFIAENDLQPVIEAVLERVDPSRPGTLEAASRAIQEAFFGARLPTDLGDAIEQAYAGLPGAEPPVAVRSSATAEDQPDFSFAGQQETFLNVSGAQDVLAAVKRCWASLWTARAISYRLQHRVEPGSLAMAVVVQVLVPAEAAGILFTADPISGQRRHAVISAAWGLGEAVVGGMVTPDSITVDIYSGAVLARETADKTVMTVSVGDGTEEQPVPEDLRQVAVLDDAAAIELAQLGAQIEELYGQPMDIEWARVDGRFTILQARPITALPEPGEADIARPVASEWPLPDPDGRYMRASIIDLMPDPLSPLFATMGLKGINSGLRRLIVEFFNGSPETLPDETIHTINGYAYMQVSYTRGQWLRMLRYILPGFTRVLRGGVPYWRQVAQPRYIEAVARYEAQSIEALSPAELLAAIQDLFSEVVNHLGALMASTMGPSAGSEGLFTRVYEKLVRQPGDPPAPTYLLGFDSHPIRAEKSLYDLAQWGHDQAGLSAYLLDASAEQIALDLGRNEPPADVAPESWQEWRRRFQDHQKHYGYSIYSLDFASPLPLDDPAPQLETIKVFLEGRVRSPYERQQELAERREQATQAMLGRMRRGPKQWVFRKSLNWAQSMAPLREEGIAQIGLGYPVLHRMLAELGERFAQAGAIATGADIYWLKEVEVEALVAGCEDTGREKGVPATNLEELIAARRARSMARKQISPPPQLPPSDTFMGFKVESFLAGGEGGQAGDVLKGLGASPGLASGVARVLHGPEDFDAMQPGDILVAAITTPAWTPLFAIAKAIVTDVGGPLSHGSIVAREYGIPAVLGTGVATRAIRSGQAITVDGNAGTVILNGSQVA